MNEKELPLKKDVDLELEYKVYSLYDKIKKMWKVLIATLLAVVLIISGYLYKRHLDEENIKKASVLLSEINDAVSKNDTAKAENLIKNFEKDYSDTDLNKVVLAYKILLNREKGIEDMETAKKLHATLKTDLKSGLSEYIAYLDYKSNNITKSKNVLSEIDQKSYNFYSSKALLGFIYKREGNLTEAENVFKMLSNSKYRYFSMIGKENL